MARKKVEEEATKKVVQRKKNPVAKVEKKADSKKKVSTSSEKRKSTSTRKNVGNSTNRGKAKSTKGNTSNKVSVKVAPKKGTKTSSTKKTLTTPNSKSLLESENLKKGDSTSQKKSVSSNASKNKAKEKAVRKSRQAYSNKKDSKERKRLSPKKETPVTKIKKIITKSTPEKKQEKKKIKKKKEKKTAVYISPSQLEKQNKRKFPWELVVGLFLVVCVSLGGFKLYQKYHGKAETVNRTNSYDTLNSVVLDQTDVISGGSSNFKHSEDHSYVKETAKAKLLKVNTSGETVFEKTYESKNSSVFNSIVVTPDGYLALGSMMGDAENRSGRQLGLLVKYDKEGNVLWDKVYESSGNSQFLKGLLVSDGFLVVGSSLATSRNSDGENPGDVGALLFKYDFEGNILWQRFYGNISKAKFNSLILADNAIYVVGKNEDDLGVFARYSMDGNLEWAKDYLYTDDAGLMDIAFSNQALYVVGSKKILPNSIDNSDRKTSNTDALLIKYNLAGEIEFEKFFGGSNQERYTALTAYRNYLFAVGYSNSTDSGLKIFTDGQKKTGILIKYDTNGGIERKATYGGSNNDIMTSVVTDNSNIYMTCFTNSKDGNILTEFDNGKDSFGKLIKVDSRLRTLLIK